MCRGLVQRGGEGIASGHDGRWRMGCLDQSGCSYSLIRSRRAGSNDAPRQRAFPHGGQIPALPVPVPVIGPFEAEVDDVLVALGYEQSGNGSHTKRIVDIDPSLRQMRFGASEAGKRRPPVGNQLDPLIMWAEGREDEAVDPFGADKLLPGAFR